MQRKLTKAFSAMEIIDGALNVITFDNKTIVSIDQFPDNQNHTTKFKDLYCKKNLKESTSHTILNHPKLLETSNTDLGTFYQTYLTPF